MHPCRADVRVWMTKEVNRHTMGWLLSSTKMAISTTRSVRVAQNPVVFTSMTATLAILKLYHSQLALLRVPWNARQRIVMALIVVGFG